MIDLGLVTGIKDLWQGNLLRDYTLVVEGREFQVHKVVLAAVSEYFRAMLCEGYTESKMDKVEVKGFSADIIGKLLEFIYTTDENIIAGDTLEILHCAMYLQMPMVAKFCVNRLMEGLNVQNCLDILSLMIEYSFNEGVLKLKNFVKTNYVKVIGTYNPEATSYKAFQVLIEFWERSEWEKFLFIRNWISANYKDRAMYVNELMQLVRFCLIHPYQLESLMQMDTFSNTEGSWQDLVVNAVRYHQQPVNLKVLEKSEQSRVKDKPQPGFLCIQSWEDNVTYFAFDKRRWTKCKQKGFTVPGLGKYPRSVCIEVNNFLIVCTTGQDSQIWQVFDPRTLTWSKMTNAENRKRGFVMVHHKDILYTIGGRYYPNIPSSEIEQYSFLTNKWSYALEMPASLDVPGACVLGDTLYVTGGTPIQENEVDNYEGSDGCYSLDLSSGRWERKASCLKKCHYHQMSVLNRGGEKVVFIMDYDLDLQLYSPSMDQWSGFTNNVKPDGYDSSWLANFGRMFISENSVYILNMSIPIEDESWDSDESAPWGRVCWKLIIPEKGNRITKEVLQDLPEHPHGPSLPDLCGAMLAFPPQKV